MIELSMYGNLYVPLEKVNYKSGTDLTPLMVSVLHSGIGKSSLNTYTIYISFPCFVD